MAGVYPSMLTPTFTGQLEMFLYFICLKLCESNKSWRRKSEQSEDNLSPAP